MNIKRAATIIIPIILLGIALGLGAYFLFFRKTAKKEGWSKYLTRQWSPDSNSWVCPAGYRDTGRQDKQCKVNKNTKFADMIWDESRGGSVCPKGFRKTGKEGNRACQKNDGEW